MRHLPSPVPIVAMTMKANGASRQLKPMMDDLGERARGEPAAPVG